jgi:hypothetical protein
LRCNFHSSLASNPADKVWTFCYGNELKLTYEHLQFQRIFMLASFGHKEETTREEGTGGEAKREDRRGGRDKERQGEETGTEGS